MKKILATLLITIICLLIIIYFSFNFIIKEILEQKLSKINNAPVKIEKLELSVNEQFIKLNNVKIYSVFDKDKLLITIPEFKSYYKINFKDKILILEDSEIKDLEFYGLSKNSEAEMNNLDLFQIKVNKEENNLNKKKILKEIRETYLLNINYDKNMFKFDEGAYYYNNLNKIKDKIDTFKDKYNSEPLIYNQKNKKVLADKSKKTSLDMKNDLAFIEKDLFDLDKDKFFIEYTQGMIDNFLDKNMEVTKNIDRYITTYLNAVYEMKIYNFITKYRSLIDEIKKREEKESSQDEWEFFIKNISFNANIYDINFYGELKNISSIVSKNKLNLPIRFFGEKDETIGELMGTMNIFETRANVDLNIPKLDLFQVYGELIKNGDATLKQNLDLHNYFLNLKGKINFSNLKIERDELINLLDIEDEHQAIKEFIFEVADNIKEGSIEYSYNTNTRNLEIKTDIGFTISKFLNHKKATLSEKLREKILDTELKKIVDKK